MNDIKFVNKKNGERQLSLSTMKICLKNQYAFSHNWMTLADYFYNHGNIKGDQNNTRHRYFAILKKYSKYPADFVFCDRTGEIGSVHRYRRLRIENVYVTRDVFRDNCNICADCGKSGYNSGFSQTSHNLWICGYCRISDRYFVTNGRIYHAGDDPLDYDGHNPIRSYSANILGTAGFSMGTRRKTPEDRAKFPLWLGVELEVEVAEGDRMATARRTEREVKDFAILKSDSSLRNGYEIVTIPATLAYHKSGIWDAFFEGSAKKLKSYRTDTCGMHVHIDAVALGASRPGGTSLTIGKMLTFIGMKENLEFIQAIAGRSSTQYNKIYRKKLTSRQRDSSHYDALSFSHHGTMELRIFRGNVAKEGFFKNLDFTAALCEFAATTSTQELTYAHFLGWFHSSQAWAHYRHLAAWLQRSKRVPDKAIPLRPMANFAEAA